MAAITLTGNYILKNDIDLQEESWTPLNFNGIFNGNQFVIEGLSNALFNTIDKAHIYDLLAKGTASNKGNRFGQFVKNAYGSLVERCGFEGSQELAGDTDIGGFVGRAFDINDLCKFKECWVVGELTSTKSFGYVVGGFVGGVYTGYSSGIIFEDCFARYNIKYPSGSTIASTGGFVGYVDSWVTPSFIRCYSACSFQGIIGTNVGGFCGEKSGSPTFTTCYYDTTISGRTDTGKGEPRTTAQMVYPYTDKHTSGIYVDWGFEEKHITDLTDFDFVFGVPWLHDYDESVNGGYPFLFKKIEPLVSTCVPFLFKVPKLV